MLKLTTDPKNSETKIYLVYKSVVVNSGVKMFVDHAWFESFHEFAQFYNVNSTTKVKSVFINIAKPTLNSIGKINPDELDFLVVVVTY